MTEESQETLEIGTLQTGEPHPSSHSAYRYVKKYIMKKGEKIGMLLEALASSAISGNRTAEVCGATLARVIEGKSISDRYLLGLAWFLYEMEKDKKEKKEEKRIQLIGVS